MTGPSAPPEPHLTFSPQAWRKLVLYTTLCPVEISGLGLVEDMPNGYRLTDLLLVRQDVDPIATRLDGDAVGELLVELLDRGVDPSALRLWWHSHAREMVFWSGEDEQTIAHFQNDRMLSLVSNHQLRLLGRVDEYAPRRTSFLWVDRPADTDEPDAAEVEDARAAVEAATGRAVLAGPAR